MGYPVKVKFLQNSNRPTIKHVQNEGKARADDYLKPQGFVIHSTATPGATDENESDYFDNNPGMDKSAHYFVDWDSITQKIPENEIAYHAGFSANHTYLSVEMSEPRDDDPDRARKFAEIWNRTVWLVADACVRYGWSTGPNVWSHKGITSRYPKETSHTDPYAYLQKYGKTWAELLQAIDAEIVRLKTPPVPVAPTPPPAPVEPPKPVVIVQPPINTPAPIVEAPVTPQKGEVTMEKKWYASKTIWLNMLMLVGIVLQQYSGKEVLTPEVQVSILAAVNLVLRIVTKEEIKW